MVINTTQFNDPVILLVVSLFFGSLGIDRFLLGQIGLRHSQTDNFRRGWAFGL